MTPLSLTFDRAGRAVIAREHGRVTDLVVLTSDLSARMAEYASLSNPSAAWIEAVLRVAESLADEFIACRQTRRETIH